MDDFFNDDPLDLDGDGDHIVEMCTLFDDESECFEKKEHPHRSDQPPSRGGCLGVRLILAAPGLFLLFRPLMT